jgi:hypothetical protein
MHGLHWCICEMYHNKDMSELCHNSVLRCVEYVLIPFVFELLPPICHAKSPSFGTMNSNILCALVGVRRDGGTCPYSQVTFLFFFSEATHKLYIQFAAVLWRVLD